MLGFGSGRFLRKSNDFYVFWGSAPGGFFENPMIVNSRSSSSSSSSRSSSSSSSTGGGGDDGMVQGQVNEEVGDGGTMIYGKILENYMKNIGKIRRKWAHNGPFETISDHREHRE